MNEQQLNKSRALAAVFQAAALVDKLAHGHALNSMAYETNLGSIFQLNPDTVKEIYGGDDRGLSLGIRTVEEVLSSGQSQQQADVIRYALGLIHIEGMLSKQSELMTILSNRLGDLVQQKVHFDSITNDSLVAKMADIYVDTLGKLRYRIQVKGDPTVLQQAANSNKVRAIFLSGVRAAMLWRQLGGRRWHLMFTRRKELQSIQTLKQGAL